MRTLLVAHGIALTAAFRKRAKDAAHLCLGRYVTTLQEVTLTASIDPATKEARIEVLLKGRGGESVAVSALAPTVEDALERNLARAARSLDARQPMEKTKPWTPKR